MSKFLLIIQIIFLSTTNFNTTSNKEIDKILTESTVKFSELNTYQSFKLANKALELSQNNNYERGEIRSYIYMAKVLTELGAYEKAIDYLSKADEINIELDDLMKVESHRLRGIIYTNLDQGIAINEFRNQLKLSLKLKDIKKRQLGTFWAYQNMVHLFNIVEQKDSVYKYISLQKKMLNGFNEKQDFINFSTAYTQVADYLISINRYDEAELYLYKSLDILKKYNSPYLYNTYTSLGRLYNLKGDSIKAIEFYKKSISNAKFLNSPNALKESYKNLADYLVNKRYLKIDASEYYYEYNKLNDSLKNQNKLLTNKVFNHIVETEKNDSVKKVRHTYIIILIVIISLVFIFYLYLKNTTLKRKDFRNRISKIENDYNSSINEDKFQKLLELLKGNNPEFLILFKELYPDFVTKIKTLNPTIKSSELSFCAMLYLNYSTKDIAEITFVTVRAVQIRKNRLRKKYHIDSDIDINKWMRNL